MNRFIRQGVLSAVVVIVASRAIPTSAGDAGHSGVGMKPEMDLSGVAGMPVIQAGRLKPFNSAARQILRELSGRNSCQGKTAVRWLADTLFHPEATEYDRVFLIDNPAVAQALDLHTTRRGRYSLHDIKPALPELDSISVPSGHVPGNNLSTVDRQVLQLRDRLAVGFAVSEQVSPAPGCGKEWIALSNAYRHGDAAEFAHAVHEYRIQAARSIRPAELRKVAIETALVRIAPFFKAKILYGLAVLAYLLAFLGMRKMLLRTSLAAGGCAFALHTFGLLARMVIMSRPPVTNLYSTFLFVGWMSALLGLIIARRRDREMGALTIGLSGLVFLLIAGRYAAEGDTMGVMAAVLNSNFWLTCHVMTITIGYAGCCAAGLVGHFFLVRRWLRPNDMTALNESYRTLAATLGFGLTFTLVGTVFGGIWADQSWGRFWGWDPKENGALLIILWCAALFHAKRGGMIGPVGMAVGAIAGIQLVLLAWFGINMLGVGLHAYGRISSHGTVTALAAFFVLEAAFVYGIFFLLNQQRRRTVP